MGHPTTRQLVLFQTDKDRNREAVARYRKRTRERQRRASFSQYDRGRQIIEAAKQRPCGDCGQTFPFYVMDFDHVRGEKRGTVASLARFTGGPLQDEIAKCDVVCANCHRKRTYARGWPGRKRVRIVSSR